MIGGNPKISCAALNHGQNGGQDTADRSDFLAVHVRSRGYGVKVAEQFVGSVNQINIHAAQVILCREMVRHRRTIGEILSVRGLRTATL